MNASANRKTCRSLSRESKRPARKILNAALRLMAKYGYEGMSLQLLADEVGIHKATLFHYFSDKRELALTVYDEVARELLRQNETLLTLDLPALDQLIELCVSQSQYFAENPWVASFLMRIATAPLDSTFSVQPEDRSHPVNRALTILANWLEGAMRAGVIRKVDIRHTVFNVLGVVLFFPAAAPNLQGLIGSDPFGSSTMAARKRELSAFLRAALAPSVEPRHSRLRRFQRRVRQP